MMTTSEKATRKSITRPHLSVHYTSFLRALYHELARSTARRFPPLSGAGLPFSEISATKRRAVGLRRVVAES